MLLSGIRHIGDVNCIATYWPVVACAVSKLWINVSVGFIDLFSLKEGKKKKKDKEKEII